MYSVFQLYKPCTYPLGVLKLSTGSALTAAHFWQTAPKVSKRSLPLRTALASLRFPRSGPAPWARRDGPSLAQHGSPGIHAGRPTPQNLHSASRWGGRSRSRSKASSRSRSTATARRSTTTSIPRRVQIPRMRVQQPLNNLTLRSKYFAIALVQQKTSLSTAHYV